MAIADAEANMEGRINYIDQVSGTIIRSEALYGKQPPSLQSMLQIDDDWYTVAERKEFRDDSGKIKQVNVFLRRRVAA